MGLTTTIDDYVPESVSRHKDLNNTLLKSNSQPELADLVRNEKRTRHGPRDDSDLLVYILRKICNVTSILGDSNQVQ